MTGAETQTRTKGGGTVQEMEANDDRGTQRSNGTLSRLGGAEHRCVDVWMIILSVDDQFDWALSSRLICSYETSRSSRKLELLDACSGKNEMWRFGSRLLIWYFKLSLSKKWITSCEHTQINKHAWAPQVLIPLILTQSGVAVEEILGKKICPPLKKSAPLSEKNPAHAPDEDIKNSIRLTERVSS